jgi:hypothetical protein
LKWIFGNHGEWYHLLPARYATPLLRKSPDESPPYPQENGGVRYNAEDLTREYQIQSFKKLGKKTAFYI